MTTLACSFIVHGNPECVETGTRAEVNDVIPPVNLSTLKEIIPFEGTFHFRYKVNLDGADVWVDITDDRVILNPSHKGRNGPVLCIQVLPLSFGAISENGSSLLHAEWEELEAKQTTGNSFVSVLESAETFADRVDATAIAASKRLEEVMSSDAVVKLGQNSTALGKSITKLWSSGVAKVGSGVAKLGTEARRSAQTQTHPSSPPEEAQAVLGRLSDDLLNKQRGAEERELLVRLGKFITPTYPTQPAAWKQGGFVSENPMDDLAKTGTLGLRALVYFTTRYSHKAAQMMESQKQCTASHYPFAIVGVNLTLMLADVFSLKERKYETRVAPFWMIFEHDLEEEAFFELFSILFMHIDYLWITKKATRKEFGEIIKSTKNSLVLILERGPSSLSDLLLLFSKSGLVH